LILIDAIRRRASRDYALEGGEAMKPNAETNAFSQSNRSDTPETDAGPVSKRQRTPIRIVPKGWGREVWLVNDELYCGKILEIVKGKRCSLHFHKLKNRVVFPSCRTAQGVRQGSADG